MKKRLFSLLLVFGIILSLFVTGVSAADIYSGTCGTNLTWSLNADTGALIISGTGDMTAYSETNRPWHSYRGKITKITVESGVTSIGSYAFYGSTNLTSVTLPQHSYFYWKACIF